MYERFRNVSHFLSQADDYKQKACYIRKQLIHIF
jgi:hypothetical protein